jgi:integrase/recombinase XerD
MKNQAYIDSFVSYLREEEKSDNTVSSYLSDLKQFFTFLGKSIKEMKRDDIKAYKEHLKGRRLAVKTINRKLVSVKQLIEFLNERYELGISAKVRQEKVQQQYSLKDEELLTEEDYQKLIKVVDGAGDIRTKAILETMYFTGMRVSEMLQMRTDHIRQDVVKDIRGKGGKYRDIFISNKLRKTLMKYLQVRKQPFSVRTDYLFVGQRGCINRHTVHNLMKKYAKLAGIEETKAHAHNLRHLFCLRAAEKGFSIDEIAKLAGHSDTNTTRIYLEKPQSHYLSKINEL